MSFTAFLDQLAAAGLPVAPGRAIRSYLEVGGFPFRVEGYIEAERRGAPRDPAEGIQVFDDIVFYEFGRRRLDRSIALEVLGKLATITTTATSYESFARALTVGRDTARKYLDVLGDAFLLATISSYDTGRGRVAPKKDRKFLWIDPALGFLPPWLRQGEAATESARAEWVVGAALLREFEARLWEGLSSPRNVFTWRSKAGNELDYLVVDRSRRLLFPVEVKHQRTIVDWDFQGMERAFGRGLLVTPDVEKVRPKSSAVTLERFLREAPRLIE
jgi:predicted AAA+ superfamily ATPase